MAKDLAERFPEARQTLRAIDETLRFPLSRLMFEGPEERLTATENAQPAILAHSAAVFAIVGATVDGAAVAAAGHSLGEYSAYIAAGALAPTDAAALVRQRGELMQQAGAERPGTMAAVLGLATAEVEAACRAASSGGAVVVAANLNAPDQTVISGDPEAVAKAGAACKARGAKRVVPLKVSGAFHSSLMAPAANHLRVALEHAPFQDPLFPVIANATAEPVRDATRARRLLAGSGRPVHRSRAGERARRAAAAHRARCERHLPGNRRRGGGLPGGGLTQMRNAECGMRNFEESSTLGAGWG